MPHHAFPQPVAIFSSSLLFTTFPPSLPIDHTSIPPKLSNYIHPISHRRVILVSVDGLDEFQYTKFHEDFGPLNINVVWKFCKMMSEMMDNRDYAKYPICIFSNTDEEHAANSACLLALFVLLTERKSPWDAWKPLSDMGFKSFRDAGKGDSEWGMTIQDVLWGVWKAEKMGLLDMSTFDSEEYEYYEQPSNGDFNIIGPFIAFASPICNTYISRSKLDKSKRSPSKDEVKITAAFKNVLRYFEINGVGLVVRCNDRLYDKREFELKGIKHIEMFYEDGSNPSEQIVRDFLTLADKLIKKGGKIAVHCKAGLGRTGVLIGAYLVYKYGFSAPEAIAFMRIMRPGMVVGPQQMYMATKFALWARWNAVDEYKAVVKAAKVTPSTPLQNLSTPMNTKEDSDREGTPGPTAGATPVKLLKRVAGEMDDTVTKAPGQPRKTPSRPSTTLRERRSSIPPVPPLPPLRNERQPINKSESSPKRRTASRIPALIPQVTKGIPSSPVKGPAAHATISPSVSRRRSQRAELPRRGALVDLYTEPQPPLPTPSGESVEEDAFGPVVTEKEDRGVMRRFGFTSKRTG